MRLHPHLYPAALAGVLLCSVIASCSRLNGTGASAPGRDAARGLVVVSPVRAQDMDRYLEGIGTVQALSTVTVRPQVDGKIVEVLFHAGQDVHKGDLLARIDPRPYESALNQAVAKLSQ